MKSKSSQNKFMKLIKMPIKALAKARDFYVRTMNKYADMGTYDGLGWGGPVYVEPMPRSLSTSTMRTAETDRDLKELVRAASTGALGNRILMTTSLFSSSADSANNNNNNNNNNNKGGASTLIKAHNVDSGFSKGVPRCGSVVMAKIEEDEPSNYDDVDVIVDNGVNKTKSKIGLFPRSRSKVVGETRKINVVL